MYTVELRIDQRPARTEVVSQRMYNVMLKLGWFDNGRAKLVS